MKLPKAKTENLVVQDLKDESLIYDQKTHKAFCLNDTLAKVFNACDGKRTFADLRRHGFTDDLIHLSLGELKAKNLLEDYESGHFGDLSRREIIRRVGLASMIALPVISSLAAPQSADAASACQPLSQSCTFDNNTQSNCCSDLRCRNFNGGICGDCGSRGQAYSGFCNIGLGPDACANGGCDNGRNGILKNVCCNTTAPATFNQFGQCLCP